MPHTGAAARGEEAKGALMCGDEKAHSLDSGLEVKGLFTPSQAKQNGSGNIMTVWCEESTKRQRNAFVQGEAGHA